jgi:hypothetical protein
VPGNKYPVTENQDSLEMNGTKHLLVYAATADDNASGRLL